MRLDSYKIRRCTPADEAGAYAVCLATGDSGQDGTHLFADDPMALGHIFVGPYIRLEPEFAYVLEDDIGVCGYVLGALDSKLYYRRYLEQWLPGIRARHREPVGDRADWTPTEQVYFEYYHPDIYYPERYAEFPSHAHIDLMARAQGRGLGGEMMNLMLEKLRAAGSPGVHLGLAEINARAERFYRKLGFEELIRRNGVLYMGKHLAGWTSGS